MSFLSSDRLYRVLEAGSSIIDASNKSAYGQKRRFGTSVMFGWWRLLVLAARRSDVRFIDTKFNE